MNVNFPMCDVLFGAVNPPQADIIDVRVNLGCTQEVSVFEVLLQNWDKKYSPGGTTPISVGLLGGIGICRAPNNPAAVPIISLKVESIKYESSATENYVRVSGRCIGERLFRRVVTKTYENEKGEYIVKDLLDNYVGLSHVRYVEEVPIELVEDTDTTYTSLKYVDAPVWDILKYIAESSDRVGVIGFDFRVASDGKFEFFPKGSKVTHGQFATEIESSEYREDIHRIRNKITVYGEADKSVPLDKDAWTVILSPPEGVWTATAGVVAQDNTVKARGESSIKCHVENNYNGSLLFTLNDGYEVNCDLYPLFSFFGFLEDVFSGEVDISLFDVADKIATKNTSISADEQWHISQLRVGSASVDGWDIIEAGFDWTQIKRIRVSCNFPTSGSGDFWLDGLFFGGRRYSAIREAAASQTTYGLREYVETDEELWSDVECDLRARGLLDYLKGPAEYLTIRSTIFDYGTTPILPADNFSVVLPNENVDSDFPIENIEYHLNTDSQTLELTLELGKVPPQLADYLYGLRTFTVNVEKLARTKLGKALGFVNYGGSGYPSGAVNNLQIQIDGILEMFENMRINPNLISGTLVKSSNSLVTTYLKESCILVGNVAVAAPTGNMNSYEAGYICRALIFKNGSGERALAKNILDLWATLQNGDGSWYQQYNPYLNASGVHDKVTWSSPGVSGDLKVDSGAALLAWAMSEYDAIGSTTIYKAVVQKALGFLRDLQYAHNVAYGTGLIANLIQDGTINTMAFSADSAECLLAMTSAMTTYGGTLLTTGGYSVKTMANDVYYYLCVSTWTGDVGRYYTTTYPIGMGGFPEKISFAQSLCSWANYVFGMSAFRTVADFTSEAEKCLDFINTLTQGQWGGQMYFPYTGATGETQDEFAGYTSLMVLAMNVVNASKYASQITLSISLLRWLALSDGKIYDCVKSTGELWIGKVGVVEAYGFLSLPVAQALLAGA